MPRISVVLSAFNHEAFVAETLDSVLAQDFQDWELIVRDDGSSDRTASIISQYRDPRIRLLPAGQNLGGAESLNECIRAATGEFVAVINSDDIMLPDRLSCSLAVLEARPELGAVFGRAQMIDELGQPIIDNQSVACTVFDQPNRTRFEWLRFFFLNGNGLCHPSILIRRKVYEELGLYDPLMVQLPDFDMWVRVCSRYEIHVLERPLIKFRLLPGERNTSGDSPRRRERLCHEYAEVLKWYAEPPIVDDLHCILPEWFSPGQDRVHRWRGLVKVAMSRAYSAHHQFAYHCLRRYYETPPQDAESAGALLALMREARPFSMAVQPTPLLQFFIRSERGDFGLVPDLTRPLNVSQRCRDVVELPGQVEQLEIRFPSDLDKVQVLGLTLHDASGAEVWSLRTGLGEVKTEGVVKEEGESEADQDVLLAMGPGGRLTLPPMRQAPIAQVRCVLMACGDDVESVTGKIGALRSELAGVSKEKLRAVRHEAGLQKRVEQLEKALESVYRWHSRPWYRRWFSAWRPLGAARNLIRRIEKAVDKEAP